MLFMVTPRKQFASWVTQNLDYIQFDLIALQHVFHTFETSVSHLPLCGFSYCSDSMFVNRIGGGGGGWKHFYPIRIQRQI